QTGGGASGGTPWAVPQGGRVVLWCAGPARGPPPRAGPASPWAPALWGGGRGTGGQTGGSSYSVSGRGETQFYSHRAAIAGPAGAGPATARGQSRQTRLCGQHPGAPAHSTGSGRWSESSGGRPASWGGAASLPYRA